MRYAEIIAESYVDGPGKRTVLLTFGCSIHCPGCQNAHLWDVNGGREVPAVDLAADLVATGLPITVSGGEPFDQPTALLVLLEAVRVRNPFAHVTVYTGRTFEQLIGLASQSYDILGALALVDVLVDGPFVQALDNDRMQYRGSGNQRVIDVQATLRQPAYETLFNRGPALLNWDTPEIVITSDGDALGAMGLMDELFGGGTETRRCGEIA
jgi:anaerobic ribonucleoside-triphosphate reductase activating protein